MNTEARIEEAKRLFREDKLTPTQISKRLQMSKKTLYKYIPEFNRRKISALQSKDETTSDFNESIDSIRIIAVKLATYKNNGIAEKGESILDELKTLEHIWETI